MPLIPLALWAAGAVGTVFGVKKTLDGKANLNEADAIAERSARELNEARAAYCSAADAARAQIELLGRQRIEIQAGPMSRLVDVVSRVNSFSFRPLEVSKAPAMRDVSLAEIVESATIARGLIEGGIACAGTGTAVYTGVSALAVSYGTASTGTAISTLSGAAASKATLAYLGGGTVSAGGLGAAGGAIALGVASAGAVIGVAGVAFEKHTEAVLLDATERSAAEELCAAEIRGYAMVAEQVAERAIEIRSVISELSTRLDRLLVIALRVVDRRCSDATFQRAHFEKSAASFDSRSWIIRVVLKLFGKEPKLPPDPADYANFSEEDKSALDMAVATGIALYQILKLEIVDEAGNLVEATLAAANQARRSAMEFSQ